MAKILNNTSKFADGTSTENQVRAITDKDLAQLAEVSKNTTDIATNKTNIATNKSDITTNTSNISNNKKDISTNTTNITTNTSDISTNETNIATNKTNIDLKQDAHDNALTTNSKEIVGAINEIKASGIGKAQFGDKTDTTTQDRAVHTDEFSSFPNIANNTKAIADNRKVIGTLQPKTDSRLQGKNKDVVDNINQALSGGGTAKFGDGNLTTTQPKAVTSADFTNFEEIPKNKASISVNATNIATNTSNITSNKKVIDAKQNITDTNLKTTTKKIVPAINEIFDKPGGVAKFGDGSLTTTQSKAVTDANFTSFPDIPLNKANITTNAKQIVLNSANITFKQSSHDPNLKTTAKDIVPAINELKDAGGFTPNDFFTENSNLITKNYDLAAAPDAYLGDGYTGSLHLGPNMIQPNKWIYIGDNQAGEGAGTSIGNGSSASIEIGSTIPLDNNNKRVLIDGPNEATFAKIIAVANKGPAGKATFGDGSDTTTQEKAVSDDNFKDIAKIKLMENLIGTPDNVWTGDMPFQSSMDVSKISGSQGPFRFHQNDLFVVDFSENPVIPDFQTYSVVIIVGENNWAEAGNVLFKLNIGGIITIQLKTGAPGKIGDRTFNKAIQNIDPSKIFNKVNYFSENSDLLTKNDKISIKEAHIGQEYKGTVRLFSKTAGEVRIAERGTGTLYFSEGRAAWTAIGRYTPIGGTVSILPDSHGDAEFGPRSDGNLTIGSNTALASGKVRKLIDGDQSVTFAEIIGATKGGKERSIFADGSLTTTQITAVNPTQGAGYVIANDPNITTEASIAQQYKGKLYIGRQIEDTVSMGERTKAAVEIGKFSLFDVSLGCNKGSGNVYLGTSSAGDLIIGGGNPNGMISIGANGVKSINIGSKEALASGSTRQIISGDKSASFDEIIKVAKARWVDVTSKHKTLNLNENFIGAKLRVTGRWTPKPPEGTEVETMSFTISSFSISDYGQKIATFNGFIGSTGIQKPTSTLSWEYKGALLVKPSGTFSTIGVEKIKSLLETVVISNKNYLIKSYDENSHMSIDFNDPTFKLEIFDDGTLGLL